MNLQKLFRISFLSLLVIGVLGTSSHCLMAFAEGLGDHHHHHHHHDSLMHGDHDHGEESGSTQCCEDGDQEDIAFWTQTSKFELIVTSVGALPSSLNLDNSIVQSRLYTLGNPSKAPPNLSEGLLAFRLTVRLLL